MYPQGRHPTPLQSGQPFKFSILEICDRIKEEFQFLQAQYHSLKLECEKLASEKTEMQRHYVMVRVLVCQDGESGTQGLARSENTCVVNPNSLGHFG